MLKFFKHLALGPFVLAYKALRNPLVSDLKTLQNSGSQLIEIGKSIRKVELNDTSKTDLTYLAVLYAEQTKHMSARAVQMHKLQFELAACVSYAAIPAISCWLFYLKQSDQIGIELLIYALIAETACLLINAYLICGRVIASHQLKIMMNTKEYLKLLGVFDGLGLPFCGVAKW